MSLSKKIALGFGIVLVVIVFAMIATGCGGAMPQHTATNGVQRPMELHERTIQPTAGGNVRGSMEPGIHQHGGLLQLAMTDFEYEWRVQFYEARGGGVGVNVPPFVDDVDEIQFLLEDITDAFWSTTNEILP